jgi:acyl-CoA dehydrogenase
LAQAALAAQKLMQEGDSDPAHAARIALCRFFAENIAVGAKGLEDTVMSGSGFLQDANLALAS